ncbi:MAG: hypothetical protein XD96_1390, partial [Petrotoga mobilis]
MFFSTIKPFVAIPNIIEKVTKEEPPFDNRGRGIPVI